jgi:hypothetical protein
MPGFSSLDDFINKNTVLGQFFRTDWNKLTHATTAQVAGEAYCLFHSSGNPTTGVLNGGTNLSFQSLNEKSTGSILHNGVVGPTYNKHLFNASVFSAAATVNPAVMMLVDLLGYYPMSTVTTTGDQATINSTTFTAANATDIITHAAYDIADLTRVRVSNSGGGLPAGLAAATDYWTIRQSATTSKLATSYANAIAQTAIDITTDGTGTQTISPGLPRYTDGAGVDVFVTPTTVMGAATPNMRITYTNPAGTAGKLTPTSPALPIGKTAAPIGLIAYSGTGSGKYNPAMPRAAGDTGVQSIQQLNLSASYVSGALSYVMYRQLLSIPITTLGVAGERDLLSQQPSLPRIYDGACLAWLMVAGAATPVNSSLIGHIDFAFG